METNKKYYDFVGDNYVEVGIEIIIAQAIVDLMESGIDEYAHYRDSWEELDDNDLEVALNDSEMISKIFEASKKGIIDKLNEALESRKQDSKQNKELEFLDAEINKLESLT